MRHDEVNVTICVKSAFIVYLENTIRSLIFISLRYDVSCFSVLLSLFPFLMLNFYSLQFSQWIRMITRINIECIMEDKKHMSLCDIVIKS